MRISKGLENIHSVIDRHENEWRTEHGEVVSEVPSLEEKVRERLTTPSNPSGKFSADRFMGAKPESKSEGGAEFISVIKHQDNKNHSWLYNEVVKAINDAVGNDRNTKVVAIFVPVVQNGKEFEDLPVDTVVTLPPVSEEDVKVDVEEILNEQETQSEEFALLPESQDEPDTELAEAFQVMEEKLDETLQTESENESEPEPEIIPETTESTEIIESEPEVEAESESESEPVIEEIETVGIEEIEPTQEPEILQHEDIEPETEAKLETENETETEIEIKSEDDKTEEILVPPLPDDLDDDEVFDDSQLDLPEDIKVEEDDEFKLEDAVEIIN